MAGAPNDRQLLNTALRLRDAYDQPRLVFEIPPDAEPLAVINIYQHARFPEEKVHCIHCNGKRHAKGFTAILTDGNRALFGSTCGGEFFGTSWGDREEEFREQLDRQYELRMIERAKIAAAPLSRALRSWRIPVQNLDAVLRGFQRGFPELWAGLAAAHHARSGQLTLPESVRDLAAEARDKSDSSPPRWMTVEKPYGWTAGGQIFEVQKIAVDFEEARDAHAAYRTIFDKTDGKPTSELRSLRQRFERGCQALDAIYALRAAASDFFAEQNLRVVIGWHRRRIGETLSITGQRLQSKNGLSVGLTTAPELPTEPIELIREFRRAD